MADDDSFLIAVNNIRAATRLLVPGQIFAEDNLPELVETDIHRSDIGGEGSGGIISIKQSAIRVVYCTLLDCMYNI